MVLREKDEAVLTTVAIDTTSSGVFPILDAGDVATNKRPRIVSWFLKVDGATDITIENTDGTDLSGPIPFGSGDGGPSSAIMVGTYGKGLQLNVGTSGVQVGGYVTYYIGF